MSTTTQTLAHLAPPDLADIRRACTLAGRADLVRFGWADCTEQPTPADLHAIADALDALHGYRGMYAVTSATIRRYAEGWRRELVNIGLPGHPRTRWSLVKHEGCER